MDFVFLYQKEAIVSSYGWGNNGDEGSSGQPTNLCYRGPAPFSEPETAAVRVKSLLFSVWKQGLKFTTASFLSFLSSIRI